MVASTPLGNPLEDGMRKIVTTALFTAVLASTAFAQAAPTGPADCKSTEVWDEATKTCKLR